MIAKIANISEHANSPRAKRSLNFPGTCDLELFSSWNCNEEVGELLQYEPQRYGLPAKDEELNNEYCPKSGMEPEKLLWEKSTELRLFKDPISLGRLWFMWFQEILK